jgi:hypothetical protein
MIAALICFLALGALTIIIVCIGSRSTIDRYHTNGDGVYPGDQDPF